MVGRIGWTNFIPLEQIRSMSISIVPFSLHMITLMVDGWWHFIWIPLSNRRRLGLSQPIKGYAAAQPKSKIEVKK